MTRKEFLKFSLSGIVGGAALALWPSCSGSSSTTPPPTTGGTFTSSTVETHTHTVTLDRSEVESPPAAGISRDTSSNAYPILHSHVFAMTQAELQSVNSGNTVTISTSVISGHSHTFDIKKWF